MSNIMRFGVSMERGLLEKFDSLAQRRGAANRSEAIRNLVRDALVAEGWQKGRGKSMAAVVIVYNHKARELDARLNRIQHAHPEAVVSSLHIHVDHERCMEIIVLRGERALLSELGYRLIGTKGVIHGRLVASTTGEDVT